LLDKWNSAPDSRPVAGIDTNSDPRLVENWYFAVWSYNGFTGPGANRSNHPLDPVYGAWPRTPYSCGPLNDGLGHNRSLYPYQELVYGCMAHPPVVQGQPVWAPLDATLPDLNNPYWRTPLELARFQSPYNGMDMPTAKPEHEDPTPRPDPALRDTLLGEPRLAVNQPIVLVNVRPGQSSTPVEIRVRNEGTGITPWRVSANKPWVRVSHRAGASVGADLPCLPSSPCERETVLRISVDPALVSGTDAAVLRIQGLGEANEAAEIAVFVQINFAIGVPGTSRD
jgi:hypothetical protein